MKISTAVLALVFFFAGCGHITGNGQKVGTIIKLSQEGFFIKTWEAEMVRGGMNGGSGSFSTTPLHVTIDNLTLLPAVQQAFDDQKEVVVSYQEKYFTPFDSECSDGCKFLTSIKER